MIIGIISRRPTSIVNDRIILEKPENPEKLPIGPTTSSPGPTLLMQVITDVKLVSKLNPSMEISKNADNNIEIYTTKYLVAECTVSLDTTSPSRRTTFTERGRSMRRIS